MLTGQISRITKGYGEEQPLSFHAVVVACSVEARARRRSASCRRCGASDPRVDRQDDPDSSATPMVVFGGGDAGGIRIDGA